MVSANLYLLIIFENHLRCVNDLCESSPAKIIDWYPNAVAQLALRGIKAAITYFGQDPKILIVPYTAAQVQTLAATSDDWAVLVTSFSGRMMLSSPGNALRTSSTTKHSTT